MATETHPYRRPVLVLLALIALASSPISAGAQTNITAPKNKYSPEQDVQLGEKAAAQVRQQMPVVRTSQVQAYVENIGRRLVDAIPAQFQHPQFHYTFQVVDAKDLNAFALPGGPMFICRGMVEGVTDEGELAGVMAHELSHVALRHGTAQATKATPYEIGEIAGQILGAVVGGTAGQVISAGSQFGIGTAFLRFSREYERQADILGSHIMARAGYDPRDMAQVFQMLEKQGGPGAPEWLSDHPNPGNRYQYIMAEAKTLDVTNPVHDTGELHTVQADLRRLPAAPTMAQLEKAAQNGSPRGNSGGGGGQPVGTSGTMPPPSSQYRVYDEGAFRISVPDNWQAAPGNNAVRFAPTGAYSNANGEQAFQAGVEVGITQAQGGDPRSATSQFVQQLMQSNPNLQPQSDPQAADVAGRNGLRQTFNNVNENGQPEVVVLETTQLDDGSLLYLLNVAPQSQFATYQSTFRRVNGSIQLAAR